MKFSHALITVSVLCALLLAAGCTQPSSPPATPTTTPTAPPTTVPTFTPVATVTTPSLTPGPVDTLPDIYMVTVDIASNGVSIDPQVATTFRGGKGINFVYSIEFQLIRSDGVVENKTIMQPLHVGDTIALASTTSNDNRAIVYVTLQDGKVYKIIDQKVPFRQYN